MVAGVTRPGVFFVVGAERVRDGVRVVTPKSK